MAEEQPDTTQNLEQFKALVEELKDEIKQKNELVTKEVLGGLEAKIKESVEQLGEIDLEGQGLDVSEGLENVQKAILGFEEILGNVAQKFEELQLEASEAQQKSHESIQEKARTIEELKNVKIPKN